jgi:hypothetical protein
MRGDSNVKRPILLLALLAAALFAVSACGGDDLEEEAEDVAPQVTEAVDEATGAIDEATGAIEEGLQIELAEQNASGQSGTATLSPGADATIHVAIELSNPPADPQPAHIHEGTCAELNPEPAFPLTNVMGGSSETDVEIGLDDLLGGATSYAINVHKSEAEADVYVACGDIFSVTP